MYRGEVFVFCRILFPFCGVLRQYGTEHSHRYRHNGQHVAPCHLALIRLVEWGSTSTDTTDKIWIQSRWKDQDRQSKKSNCNRDFNLIILSYNITMLFSDCEKSNLLVLNIKMIVWCWNTKNTKKLCWKCFKKREEIKFFKPIMRKITSMCIRNPKSLKVNLLLDFLQFHFNSIFSYSIVMILFYDIVFHRETKARAFLPANIWMYAIRILNLLACSSRIHIPKLVNSTPIIINPAPTAYMIVQTLHAKLGTDVNPE